MDALKQEYMRILQGLRIDKFNLDEDEYSGVFLPAPFDEYWTAKTKGNADQIRFAHHPRRSTERVW